MKAKIVIPSLIEYDAYILGDAEEFKKQISGNAYGFNVTEINGKLSEVSFTWNPYGIDYPDSYTVKPNEIFMVETDNKENVKIVKSIEDWWLVYGLQK